MNRSRPSSDALAEAAAPAEIESRSALSRDFPERLLSFISNLPGGVAYRCRNEPDYPIEFITEGISELAGYPPEDFRRGRVQIGQLIHPEDRERIWQEVQSAVAAHRPFELTYRIQTASGVEKWIWEKGQGTYNEGGELLALEGFALDITARKQAEDALRRSEARFRAIIETEPECVKIVTATGELAEMNPAGLAMIEVESLAKARSCPLLDWIAPRDRPAFAELHQQVMRGETGRLEFEIIGAKGTHRWLETCAVPLRDSDGKPTALLGVTRDVTEQKRAQELLAGQNDVLEMIASGASLVDTLNKLCHLAETQSPGVLASILLLDEDGLHLRHAAAPSLSDDFVQLVDGLAIGPNVGSCGTAAFRGEPVVVGDIETDPLWIEARNLVRPFGLRACWSFPLFGAKRQVVGTFALYQREPGMPQPAHLKLLQLLTHTAEICLHRHSVEQTLRAAEAKYRALFENSIEGIFQSTPEGRFLTVNPAMARILGYSSPDELIALRTDIARQGYVNPADRAHFIAQIVAHGSVQGFECQVYRKDRSIIWVSENARAVLGPSGQIAYFEGTLVDITSRREAEEKLRFSEANLARAQKIARLGSWELDLERNVLFWSEEAFRIFGVDPHLGPPSRDAFIGLVHPDDRERLRTAVDDSIRLKQPYHVEHRIVRADGNIRHVSEHADVSTNQEGNVNRLIGAVLDITQLKEAELALQRSEAHFRSLIENAQDIITLLDADGIVRFQSPSGKRLLGIDPAEMIGQTAFAYIHAEDAELVRAALTRAFALPETPQMVLLRFRHANGSWRHLESIGRALKGGPAPMIVVNSRDITERKQLEEQLRQSQKMEAIGQLAGGVAHDFNNLLTIIEGQASLLLSGGHLNREDHDSAEQIVRAAERASALTQQLLLFGRKQVMQLKEVNLNDTVSNISKMLHRILGEDINLQLETAPRLPLIRADSGMLEQILLNLAVNARDAMPAGGLLRVRTGVQPADAQVNPVPPDTREVVQLTVEDSGCGITPENLPRIFEPFFTTKQVGKGTGLGLATVYGIVKEHNGWISVDSEPGVGSTFHIFFPAISRSESARSATGSPAKVRGGTETILLVEDEEDVRSLAKLILQRYGYVILEAADGASALRVWEEKKSEIQMVLTDMVMPKGISGRDLADQIHAQSPDLPILYTSGYSPDVFGKGIAQSIRFLPKPYEPRELARAVRDCLDNLE